MAEAHEPVQAPALEKVFLANDIADVTILLTKFEQASKIAAQASEMQATLKAAIGIVFNRYNAATVRHENGALLTKVNPTKEGEKFNRTKAAKYLTAAQLSKCYDKTPPKAPYLIITLPKEPKPVEIEIG